MMPPQSLMHPDSTGQALTTTLHGQAGASGELLHSPASGAACVHWRLRIFERISPSTELVHEVIAPEPFEMSWRSEPLVPPRPIRLDAERVHIEAQPVLHREGSAGAQAVAGHFGLQGRVRVEEVLIRQGETIEASGVLFDPASAGGAGPFRATHTSAELCDATVKLSAGLSFRPALLPWALGTAAALFGAAGAVSALSKLWKLRMEVVVGGAAEIGPVKVRRPRWP
jgi:hypothetical protein